MRRLLPLVALVAVLAIVGGAIAVAALSDGPAAFSVGAHSVPQRTLDSELRELAENQPLADAIRRSGGTQLGSSPGSVTSITSSGWIGLEIAQIVAADRVERQGLTVTAADRTRGNQLAQESVGGPAIFATFSSDFRSRLAARWDKVAVLERRLVAAPTPALARAVAAACPSGRYVSHILVATRAEALAIKSAIDAGGDFAAIARTSSTDRSKTAGGALGCLDGQNFVEPFATVAKTQPIGVVSDPVETTFGFHLVLVTDQPSASDFAQLALQVVLGRAKGVAVELDPRYGLWERRNGRVVPQPVRGVATQPGSATL